MIYYINIQIFYTNCIYIKNGPVVEAFKTIQRK